MVAPGSHAADSWTANTVQTTWSGVVDWWLAELVCCCHPELSHLHGEEKMTSGV